jgi:hypothetical protein
MTITPEQAAHDMRNVVVNLPSRVMMDPASYGRGAEIGFEGMDFYFAGRGGVLGDVSARVVTAALVFWAPEVVRASWERSAAVMPRRQAAEEWASAFSPWARQNLPEHRDWSMCTSLLRRVLETALVAGAPIFAGWLDLPEPDDLRELAMYQLNALRELRGAMHGAAVLTVGLAPVEAITVRTPDMLGVYGWSDEAVDPEPFHQRWGLAEARTDRMFGRALAVLDGDERGALVDLLGTLVS